MDDARRALRPFERVIVFLGGLVLVGLLLQLGDFAMGHTSFLGFGSPEVCVTVSPWSSQEFPGSGNVRVTGLADGGRASVHTVNICRVDPTTSERALSSLDQGALLVFGLGLLFLLWRLLRQARLHGVFVEAFARRVTGLGLYVLLGMAAVMVVRSWAGLQLQKSLIPDGSHQAQWYYSFTPLLVGLGLITVGRVMAAAVPMREELDATV